MVGVEENVGYPAMVAVPWASCLLKGMAGCSSWSRTGSLMPICAAYDTAESGTSREFIWARALATTCNAVASLATTWAFCRNRQAEVADDHDERRRCRAWATGPPG